MSLAGLLGANELPDGIEPSDTESRRFGVAVARVEIGPENICSASDVVELVERTDADVVVVRYPADRVAWAAELESAGRFAFHADTIVYWELTDPSPQELPEGVTARVARPDESGLVHDLAHSAFADYGSHYRANPLFDRDDIALGYAEWAAAQVEPAGSAVLVLSHHGKDVAFAAVDLSAPRSEITLSGVAQWGRGRGAYRASMAIAETASADQRCDALVISTQVHNTVVQRVWAGRGYLPIHTFETVHFVRRGMAPGPWSRV